MGKSRKLLQELMESMGTIGIDMSGDHRYALSFKSHKILTKINQHLAEQEVDICCGCEHGEVATVCTLPALTPCPYEERV